MRRKPSVAAWLITGLVCLAVSGCCGPARTYFARRGRDLADCFQATVGFGLPAYARVKASDFVVVGCGMAGGGSAGWRGRYLGWQRPQNGRGVTSGIEAATGLPVVWNTESVTKHIPGGAWHEAKTKWLCFTRRWFPEGRRPGPHGELAEKFWVGARAVFLLSARVEVNPVEFVDFVAGCAGWDMLADDDWQPESGETKK